MLNYSGKLIPYSLFFSRLHIFYAIYSSYFFSTCLKERIDFQGWARRVETRGKFLFVHISDGCSLKTVQAVVQRDICPKVPIGSAVDVVGDWVKSHGKQQNMELFATNCEVVGLQQRTVSFLPFALSKVKI